MSTGPRNRDRDKDKDRDRELAEILQEAQLVRPDALQRAQREARQAGDYGRITFAPLQNTARAAV